MLKTYKGGCHCGAVRFEAELDLEAGTGKCNCSICKKSRHWGAIVKPAAFRLLAGAEALSDYQFGTMQAHNLFCRHCGIRSFGRGHVKEIGGDYVSISIACLDEVPDEVLASLPVHHANGRDNDWMNTPAVTAYL
jgi:hypothetical protein